VPRREVPDWLVQLLARCGLRLARAALPELGKLKNSSSNKARRVLGWQPRDRDECIRATAASLLRLGLVKD
jgi:hypothetical protein